jgi:anti-sigma B factor antagonist
MPHPHHLAITTREGSGGDSEVLVLDGDVDLQTAPQLRDQVLAAADRSDTVVIDLERVQFMDSPGLGILVYADKVLKERGSHLVLRSPRGDVRLLFDTVRLDGVLNIEP